VILGIADAGNREWHGHPALALLEDVVRQKSVYRDGIRGHPTPGADGLDFPLGSLFTMHGQDAHATSENFLR
jgi:hypothetical protein